MDVNELLGGWGNFMGTPGGGSTVALIGVALSAFVTNKINKRSVREARREKAIADREANHAVLESISIKAHDIERAVGDYNLDNIMWYGHLAEMKYPSQDDEKRVETFLRDSYTKCCTVIEEGKDFFRQKEVVLRGRDDKAADLVKVLLGRIENDLENFSLYDNVGRQDEALRQTVASYADGIRRYRTATKRKRRLIPGRPSRG